jgi:hypothetical protein
MMDSVMQFEGTVYQGGYGLIAREVMKVDPKILHRNAKVIYSYICSYGAASNSSDRTAFPSVEIQCDHLGMTIDTYYKYRKQLITNGYLRITKVRDEGGKFEKNLYTILSFAAPLKDLEPHPKKSGMDKKPYPKKSGMAPHPNLSGTVKPYTAKRVTNSNSFNSNNFNNNNVTRIVNKEPLNPFSREGLKEIVNSYYSKLAPGRWTKRKWNELMDRLIEELTEGQEFCTKVENPYGYIKVTLENIANRHDWKHGKKEIEEVDEEGLVPFYDWIEER